MKKILLYLWQLPQNLLGLLLRKIYKGGDSHYNDLIVRESDKMKGGISLGKYIIVGRNASKTTILHESGHSKQSKYLGPLYLLAVGIPSAMKASVHNSHDCTGKANWFYYGTYPENWADKLVGIERDFYNPR